MKVKKQVIKKRGGGMMKMKSGGSPKKKQVMKKRGGGMMKMGSGGAVNQHKRMAMGEKVN